MSDTPADKVPQIVLGQQGLDFVTPDGRPVLRLRVFPDGSAQLLLAGPTGGAASLLAATDLTCTQVAPPGSVGKADAGVSLMAGAGKSVVTAHAGGFQANMTAEAAVSAISVGVTGTRDTPQRPIVGLAADAQQGFLSVVNNAGNVVLDMRSQSDGGRVTVSDNAGQGVVYASADQGDGVLAVRDANGANVFEVPKWKFTPKTPPADPAPAATAVENLLL